MSLKLLILYDLISLMRKVIKHRALKYLKDLLFKPVAYQNIDGAK